MELDFVYSGFGI
ncbi:hypothetical protein A3Q56_08494 [Intoshia linei]|uniref:Uncharacterized protein n=1 Tax=Intoshia linei TaxID=1819745 RepID=A0A177AP56_9BILA|nr:hypothetical protein A3Q56_08494 [Intoshia linei]